MSYTASASTSIKTTPSGTGRVVRELIAAMPIVLFAKALRAALQRRAS